MCALMRARVGTHVLACVRSNTNWHRWIDDLIQSNSVIRPQGAGEVTLSSAAGLLIIHQGIAWDVTSITVGSEARSRVVNTGP